MNSSGIEDRVELLGVVLGDGTRNLGGRRVDLLGDDLLDGGNRVLDEGRHFELLGYLEGCVLDVPLP